MKDIQIKNNKFARLLAAIYLLYSNFIFTFIMQNSSRWKKAIGFSSLNPLEDSRQLSTYVTIILIMNIVFIVLLVLSLIMKENLVVITIINVVSASYIYFTVGILALVALNALHLPTQYPQVEIPPFTQYEWSDIASYASIPLGIIFGSSLLRSILRAVDILKRKHNIT